jgi:YegS/Rv2252/BmrU family lipid kinase
MSTVAILNPKSGSVKSSARTLLSQDVEVLETKSVGHAIELTRGALRRGARTVIAIGGDGTINEVVNGFFDGTELITPDAVLAIIPHGTGSDLCRTIKLPPDEKKAVDFISVGIPQSVDVARVQYTTMDGKVATRYSINLTSFGMGGAVAARANQSSKALGGKISFLIATLTTALKYRGREVRLQLDDSEPINAVVMNVAVGNGQYHGGGMCVCPGASLTDGLLDVTIIRAMTLARLVASLPMLYNGNIYKHPKVTFHQAKRIQASSNDTTLVEIDGEPLGKLPIQITIIPGALRILMP